MIRPSATRGALGRALLALVLIAPLLAGIAGGRAEASIAPPPAQRIASTSGPAYQLEGFRWYRSSVPVYFNWEGGTCVFAGTNLSGPATAIPPAVLTETLQASINALNVQLRGGLTLVFAGAATHTELCSSTSTRPIVVGFGAIATTGQALSFGAVRGDAYSSYTAARVFASNTTDFSCPGEPVYRDLQLTMMHELLHSIGIGHSTDPQALMAPTFNACQGGTHGLNADDLAAIAALYPPTLPPPSAATPTATATAVPTAVTTAVATPAFRSTVIFAPSGQALAVFVGGSAVQLEAAAGGVGATGAWVQDARGIFRLLVVNGPPFLRTQFQAAFPQGIPPNSAVTLVR